MNIRYFFIAGAITSGLALALQESDRIVNQEKDPIITPYTVDEVYNNDLQHLEPINGKFDTLNIIITHSNNGMRERERGDLYQTGKNLLYSLTEFLHSVVMFCVKMFFIKKLG
ncbi:hypothetical protein [Bartonella machadoae]|uniref:hypothetical protein n=1 Tax=Bartonella machadoae TaxID=2893471 RepID=UPI001F4CE6C8|nr:hypothetical protein [Bartonella machadoae]UNE53934.1 hypothetical protein LNM86_10170 [Bartonella machadoae]